MHTLFFYLNGEVTKLVIHNLSIYYKVFYVKSNKTSFSKLMRPTSAHSDEYIYIFSNL